MCCDSGGDKATPPPGDNKFTDTLADIASKQQSRAESTFYPLEDRLVKNVERFQTPEYAQQKEGEASADVSNAFSQARAAQDANDASMGVNPADGMRSFAQRGLTIAQAGQQAGAVTQARQGAENLAFDTLAGVSGKGDAKIGQAISAANAGGNIYSQNVRNGLSQENMDNQGASGMGSMVGTGLSVAAMFL
jgi:hypothetical protein